LQVISSASPLPYSAAMARPLLVLLSQLVVAQAASSLYRCVFFHGIGTPDTSNATESDTRHTWGGEDIIKHTPFCTSRVFLHQQTLYRGWDDAELQKAACDLAISNSSDSVIRSTAIISHSMGNLYFAEALRRGTCSLDSSSSQWISIGAPWLGTKMASWIHKICSNHTSNKLLRWLAKELNYCDPGNPGEVYPAYETLKPNFPGLQNLAFVADAHVTRALCGTSVFGLPSKYSAALAALARAVKFGEPNDAIVPVSSCLLPGHNFRKHYAERFYLAEINHMDGTCRAGNDIFGSDSKQPCSWLARGGELTEQPVFV